MKKNCLVMLLVSMLLFAACGQSEIENSDAGSSTEGSSAPNDGAGQNQVTVPEESVKPDAGSSQGTEDVQESESGTSQAGTTGESQQSTSYTWQEITITIPAAWQEACLFLEEEDGFAVYQKTSYEKDRSGYICSFRRGTEYFNYGAGETLVAYTDSGVLYYLIQPTDVACDSRDEAILSEYVSLCDAVDSVKASLEIAVDDVHMDAKEYVLPISGILLLDKEMVQYLSDNELWIARNEIYARHGRKFTNSYLQMYFERCTWYEGTVDGTEFDDSILSQVERDNIALLQAAEAEYDAKHPYPQRCGATETVQADLHGDGSDNTVGYHVTQQENGDSLCYVTVDGTSYLVNDLVYLWTPRDDAFYIVDIVEGDGVLEIAVLDDGPSADPVTYFFRLEEKLSYIGQVSGYPFKEENGGINGFNSIGGICGWVRTDLIETATLEGYWRYDTRKEWIVYQDLGLYEYYPVQGHTLYEDLPVRISMNENAELVTIPAQAKVYFMTSDNYQWILVKGKDGSQGYMQVKDGIIVELEKPANEVLSDLYFAG